MLLFYMSYNIFLLAYCNMRCQTCVDYNVTLILNMKWKNMLQIKVLNGTVSKYFWVVATSTYVCNCFSLCFFSLLFSFFVFYLFSFLNITIFKPINILQVTHGTRAVLWNSVGGMSLSLIVCMYVCYV